MEKEGRGHISKPDDWKRIPKDILDVGIKVEYEHTTSKKVSRRTASDHIMELGPRYYPELLKLERRLKKTSKKEIEKMLKRGKKK